MRIALLGILLMSSLLLRGQEEYSDKYRKWKKQYSEDCIVHLKNGALFVRLATRSKAIKLYRENNQEWVADRMEQEQFEENQAIMKGFLTLFNFCPVYFFYADDTELLKQGVQKGIFLNDRLKRDSTIVPQQPFYMIAEYGPLQGETYVVPDDTTKPAEYVAPNVLEAALVIKDSTMMQMMEPFPNYVHAVIERHYNKHIKLLNERLHKYYEVVSGK